jgi:Mrr N-terminal domain
MTRIEELYNSIQTLKKLGVKLPEELIEETNRVEEEIIKNDIIPALAETISPIIEQIQRGIILVVEYVPNEPLSVRLTRKRSFAIPEEQDIPDISVTKKTFAEKEKSFKISPHTKKKKNPILPQYPELFIPVVKALKALGGLGSIVEINQKVCEIEGFSAELLEIQHGKESRGRDEREVDYRLAWSRTYLKEYGILENPSRGLWTLTDLNINENKIDIEDVVAHFNKKQGKRKIIIIE